MQNPKKIHLAGCSGSISTSSPCNVSSITAKILDFRRILSCAGALQRKLTGMSTGKKRFEQRRQQALGVHANDQQSSTSDGQ